MASSISRWTVALAAGIAFASPTLAGPAEPYAKLPEISSVRISPNGERLAVTVRGDDGSATIAIVQIDGMKTLGKIAVTRGRDVADFYWAGNDRILFGLAVHMGIGEAAFRTRDLFTVNADGSGLKLLLQPQQGVNYRDWTMVSPSLPNDPNYALVRMPDPADVYTRSPAYYLYKVDLTQGRLRRLAQGHSADGAFMVDHQGHARLQTATERDLTRVILYRSDEDSEWREIGRFPMMGNGGMRPLEFASDDRSIFIADNRETRHHTTAVYRIDPENPKPTLVYADPGYDVAQLLTGRTEGAPVGVVVDAEKNEWRFFDATDPDAVLLESIRKTFHGQNVHVMNWSKDRTRIAILVDSDVDPGNYYVLDLGRAKILTRLAREPWINPAEQSPMTPVLLKARDGVPLHGYLTVPAAGTHHKLVVLPHGGPFGIRDDWGYDSEVQWLAKNGYSVLQVNYRGSRGYGAQFGGAGFGEWGGKMQDDLTDATRWAIEQGQADADKVCIFGASYGGYAALEGAVKEPTLYRCAIGYAGAYDLRRIKRSESQGAEAFHDITIGTDADALDRVSPALQAARIQVPVLLIHGGEDPICPPDQFEAMKSALVDAKKSVETLYKPNEGHGFVSPANREEAMMRIVKFLDANTGGSATTN